MLLKKYILNTLIYACFCTFTLSAQNPVKQVTKQQLIWFGYFNTLEFHPNWFLTTELQERRFMNPDKQHQFLVRSHLHYRFGQDWDVSAGFTYFLQNPNDPNDTNKLIVPELRPHIQLDYKQKFNERITISHRYRAEVRFFRNTKNGELVDGYNSNYRFRYRLGMDFKLFDINKQPFKLKLNDEIFINASDIIYNHFDQNRLYIGLNYTVYKNFSIEAGYMNLFQQRQSGDDFFDRDVIRFIVNHKIDLSKKPAK